MKPLLLLAPARARRLRHPVRPDLALRRRPQGRPDRIQLRLVGRGVGASRRWSAACAATSKPRGARPRPPRRPTAPRRRRANRPFRGHQFNRRWTTAGQSPRLLSLEGQTEIFTGGAHPSHGAEALAVGPPRARAKSRPSACSPRAATLTKLVHAPFCATFEGERAKRAAHPRRGDVSRLSQARRACRRPRRRQWQPPLRPLPPDRRPTASPGPMPRAAMTLPSRSPRPCAPRSSPPTARASKSSAAISRAAAPLRPARAAAIALRSADTPRRPRRAPARRTPPPPRHRPTSPRAARRDC